MDNPTNNNKLGIAFSGGGFRATLFHLGVIKYLKDINQLKNIKHITSVSGGSIIAAHLVLNWEKYNSTDENDFNQMVDEIINLCMYDVRGYIVRRFLPTYPFYLLDKILKKIFNPSLFFFFPKIRNTNTLIKRYKKLLFSNFKLEDLGKNGLSLKKPEIDILTTNLGTSDLCYFNKKGFFNGKKIDGCVLTDISLAVGASSAFPGFFLPVFFSSSDSIYSLTDGGAFDNLGVRRFQELKSEIDYKEMKIIVSDAGAAFKTVRDSDFSMVGTAIRDRKSVV